MEDASKVTLEAPLLCTTEGELSKDYFSPIA